MSYVDDFLSLVATWQESHPNICPRCGDDLEEELYSSLSGVSLCYLCYLRENVPQYENYDNWAIVVACRAVCGANIKIF